MLKQRVLTAIPLALGIVAAIFYLPVLGASVVFAGMILLGAQEWAQLAGLHQRALSWLYALVVSLSGWSIWYFGTGLDIGVLALAGAGWWLLIQAWMVLSAPVKGQPPGPGWLIGGWFTLALSLACLLTIHSRTPQGAWLLMFTLLLVWAADIGAYFVGRRWGRRKLAPLTSPGKSWEGALGGMAAVALLALLASTVLDAGAANPLGFVLAALLAGALSVTGDLLESRLKRVAGAKDSGTLLPGHGGVLDRIDSLTAAAPVFLFGLYLLGV